MNQDIKVRELQLAILEIFKEVIKICDNHNIKYFIVAGTALGAVRHKGFIPWDDDLDIGMTRENYNKFLSIASNKLPEDLFLQTFDSETQTPFYFAKVRKTGTIFIERYCKDLNINHGIYIDIFPYDNIPNSIKLRNNQERKAWIWSNLFIAKSLKGSSVPQKTLKGKVKLFIRLLFHYLLKPVPKKILYNKLDSISQHYNNSESELQSFVTSPSMMINSKDLEELEIIEFEGIEVSVPRNVRKHLINLYGDFMSLPPQDERVGHLPCKVKLK